MPWPSAFAHSAEVRQLLWFVRHFGVLLFPAFPAFPAFFPRFPAFAFLAFFPFLAFFAFFAFLAVSSSPPQDVLRPAVRKRKQTARILSYLDMAFSSERRAEATTGECCIRVDPMGELPNMIPDRD